ncbi:hypothetical protein [Streptomyces antarcticus]|uniref:hypothetical protein n=1 Tax=Streptomyces antarcticus TaxID=2996458 RepID=UPI0022709F2D|nr:MULTISPECIES: hypothetical protein [unclassified Streptomyces]MCY0946146.1 hypothetical protein [Streptomyces sp. H34-AA3]MCZ4088150.1 hypothetical protein [Streptomyces sp. H34-S5]
MSHEAVPESPRHTGQAGPAAHDQAGGQEYAAPAQGGAPKGLLQQMEELMAALNADLTRLDADLQSSADRVPESQSTSHRSY